MYVKTICEYIIYITTDFDSTEAFTYADFPIPCKNLRFDRLPAPCHVQKI